LAVESAEYVEIVLEEVHEYSFGFGLLSVVEVLYVFADWMILF
jgi:hypothetical protein